MYSYTGTAADLLDLSTGKTIFGITLAHCAYITGRNKSVIGKELNKPGPCIFVKITNSEQPESLGWIVRKSKCLVPWPTETTDMRVRNICNPRTVRSGDKSKILIVNTVL